MRQFENQPPMLLSLASRCRRCRAPPKRSGWSVRDKTLLPVFFSKESLWTPVLAVSAQPNGVGDANRRRLAVGGQATFDGGQRLAGVAPKIAGCNCVLVRKRPAPAVLLSRSTSWAS